MNHISLDLDALLVFLLTTLLSAVLFMLLFKFEQSRFGRRLRRVLLQPSWRPSFLLPYRGVKADGSIRNLQR